ncbi:MAG: glycosyltransferase, partial [Myxococcota bacterium]
MTPLKILQMATQSATAFKFTLPFAQYLMERGHHVAIACTDAAFPDAPNHLLEIRRTGVPVHIIPMQRTIAPGHDLLATLRAWRLMCLERFDVVHTHNAKAGFIGRLAARAALTPLVLHTNHGLPFFVADRFSWGENYLHLQLERLAARWTDRFFTVSQAEWRKAITFGVAAPSDMVQIGQGIDLTLFDPQCVSVDTRRQLRERWSIPAAAPLLGVVARLEPHKGVERVLHAVAEVQHRHPDLHVLIIGDGREQASLKQLAHGSRLRV